MPPPEKRPAPPAPDPNWELELHPPPGGAKKAPPESRDPMLAHALLQASEPDPLDLELDMLDEATDVERTTLPPPEAMSDHVARMMAEASLFEDADDTGMTDAARRGAELAAGISRGWARVDARRSARDPRGAALATTRRPSRSGARARQSPVVAAGRRP